MNTKRLAPIFLLAWTLLLAVPHQALSQAQVQGQRPEIRLAAPGELQELRLVDGSVLYGSVVEVGDTITFRLVSGDTIRIGRNRIAALSTARGTVSNGTFFREDPNRSRLFFAPTGRSIPKGGGYFAVYEIYIPFVAVAPSDRLTVSAGTPLIFGGDEDSRPFWISAKAQVVARERIQVGVGALDVHAEGHDIGVLFGVSTIGGTDRAVTLGLGYGYADGDLADRPALLLGGEARVSAHAKLMTENYVFPGGGGSSWVASGSSASGSPPTWH